MRNYYYIYPNNEKHSERIQKYLLSLGYRWPVDSEVSFLSAKTLRICTDDRMITYADEVIEASPIMELSALDPTNEEINEY